MSEKALRELHELLNPHSYVIGGVTVIDAVAVPLPPGTMAPPRPPGRERVPGAELPMEEPIVIVSSESVPIPPGTIAPPRKPSPDA